MGTERQKTVEGQHLSRVKAQRNRAIALISVFCQWWETTEKGSPGETPGRHRHFALPPFMASRRERSNLSADAVANAETPIWRGYQSFLKLYTNSSDTNILTVF
jgi:hypothetical protein